MRTARLTITVLVFSWGLGSQPSPAAQDAKAYFEMNAAFECAELAAVGGSDALKASIGRLETYGIREGRAFATTARDGSAPPLAGLSPDFWVGLGFGKASAKVEEDLTKQMSIWVNDQGRYLQVKEIFAERAALAATRYTIQKCDLVGS